VQIIFIPEAADLPGGECGGHLPKIARNVSTNRVTRLGPVLLLLLPLLRRRPEEEEEKSANRETQIETDSGRPRLPNRMTNISSLYVLQTLYM
jgi:hypothetical protein